MLANLEKNKHGLCVLISYKTNIQPGGHAPIPRKQMNTVYVFLYLAKQIYSPVDMLPYLENKRTRSMCSYILQNKYTARWTCSHTKKTNDTVYLFLYLAKQVYSPVDMLPYIENKRTRSMCSYILQNKYIARWTCPHT